jgi:predicted DNA-binding protein (MmcQ/YjbR family)
MSLPHATENVQWGADLCFKIGGKMFAVMALEPGMHLLSFKCTPESFIDLQEIEGIVPAPYMARAQWVSLQRWDALRDDELRQLLRTAYELVFAKLTKRAQNELRAGETVNASRPRLKKKAAKKAATKVTKKAVAVRPSRSAAKKKAKR